MLGKKIHATQFSLSSISMLSNETILSQAYNAFNKRDIDGVLCFLDADVDWPNGMEGGIEHGHQAVRDYWTRQWEMVNPHVEPIRIEKISDNQYDVTVHQLVKNMQGEIILEEEIHHFYTFKNNIVIEMRIVKA